MKKIKFYLKRIYRLTLNGEKQEELVWKELKLVHTNGEWNSGIYEKDKTVETVFKISNENASTFYYMIYDGFYHCRVKILEDFNPEYTTDLFVLAAHFNNILKNGVVVVNVHNNFVEYHQKRDLLIPLLYSGEIYGQMMNHHGISKDIFGAFQRLIIEQEAPAIIIADLLNKNNENPDN
jgi:hypothetical protein